MKLLFTTLKKTLFWSYERGSWQYDVMCVLILAFIFLAPNSFFRSTDAAMKQPYVVTGEELGAVEPGHVKEKIVEYLKANGHEIANPRIETVTDNASGKIRYQVYAQ